MQGLNCGVPSTTAYPMIKRRVDYFMALGDSWAGRARAWCDTHGWNIAPSGCAGLAGVLAAAECTSILPPNVRILVVLTEDATDA